MRLTNINAFLKEIYRLLKSSGILILDDGHQPRAKTKQKIVASEAWSIFEKNKDFLDYCSLHGVSIIGTPKKKGLVLIPNLPERSKYYEVRKIKIR